MSPEELSALLSRGCGACLRRTLRLRALAGGTIVFLDGEPVSTVRFREAGLGELLPRIYRVECVDCGAIAFSRDDCPLCRAPGRLSRALDGRAGLTGAALPKACPRCGLGELRIEAELRQHVLTVQGTVSRRVADAEPHEPGFHAIRVECRDCEDTVAAAPSIRCAACGASSLLRRPRP